MKKKALIFVTIVLCALMIVPAINLKLGTAQIHEGKKWWHKAVLYNFDFALPYLGRFFYPLGISTNPNQVIIGKNGWLFLGDQYENTISIKRLGADEKHTLSANRIRLATNSWGQWFKQKGVQKHLIILGPDKDTIYPESLPGWVQHATNSATNKLLASVSQGLYVDTRSALKAAKSQFSEPLYYKTDTHWNSLGAWVAFHAFAFEVARTNSDLRWLSEQQVRIAKVRERPAGDLAKFLRMSKILRDIEVTVEINSTYPIETEQYDYETGHLTASGGNPQVGAPPRPLLVRSKHALNQKRVLWLRDSFGTAMAPFMAATFTETLQLQCVEANPVLLARLVDTYKPDYVFITVVERESYNKWFENFPPST